MIFIGISAVDITLNECKAKFCCVLLGTFAGSILSYELIKRNKYSKILFGIYRY